MKKLKSLADRNHIKIEVYGIAGAGKSAIAYEIASMLTNYGIETEIMPDDDKPHDVKWVLKNKDRLNNIKNRASVTVEERNCSYDGSYKEREA